MAESVFMLDKPGKAAASELLLATVISSDSDAGTVYIQLDGTSGSSSKAYKALSSAWALPANARVVVMKYSGTYLVLGKIGKSSGGGGGGDYVEKTGDTMTGSLTMDAANILIDSGLYTIGTPPQSNSSDRNVSFRDKAKTAFGFLDSLFMANGRIGMRLGTFRTVSGNYIENSLRLFIDSSGNRSVWVPDAAPWRSALGIVLGASEAFAIPASGSSVSKNMSGLTASHQLILWNFSSSAENRPPADLSCQTYDGYFTITNNGGTTSETIKPVFAVPAAVALSNH